MTLEFRNSGNRSNLNIYLHTNSENKEPFNYIVDWFEERDQGLQYFNEEEQTYSNIEGFYLSLEFNGPVLVEKIQEIAQANGYELNIIYKESVSFEHGAGNFMEFITFLVKPASEAISNISLNLLSNIIYDKLKEDHPTKYFAGTINPEAILNIVVDHFREESKASLLYRGAITDHETGNCTHLVQSCYCDYEIEFDKNQIVRIESKPRTQTRI
jgi:hypothetical protein